MVFPPFLRALNSRNYRLFFVGQWVSLIGNWMTNTATVWLAYELSHSAFVAGLLAFASQIPLLVLGPLGGVLGDRRDKRRMLLAIQLICALLSSTLAVAVFGNSATVALLVGVATLRGLINAVEFPTRQSFIVELVGDKESLPNAIALNSTMFNIARLIGPTLAGALIVTTGPAWCYVLDAASFFAATASLLAIRTARKENKAQRKHPLAEFREGLRYARSRPFLRAPLTVVPLICLSGFAGSVLAPVFAKDIYGGDARALGYLLSAVGVGALFSALYLGSRRSPEGLPAWIARGAFVVGLSQIGLALSGSLAISCLFLVGNGAGVVLVLAGSNTYIQARVDDALRGRIMGLYVMGQGLYPVGSLGIGFLASSIGARSSLFWCSLVSLLAALVFLRMSPSEAGEPESLGEGRA